VSYKDLGQTAKAFYLVHISSPGAQMPRRTLQILEPSPWCWRPCYFIGSTIWRNVIRCSEKEVCALCEWTWEAWRAASQPVPAPASPLVSLWLQPSPLCKFLQVPMRMVRQSLAIRPGRERLIVPISTGAPGGET